MKPILFNTEMVQAILEGRKTVTRRVLKRPFEIHSNGYITKPRKIYRFCPYESPYEVNDVLYVRETWNEWTGGYVYKAWCEPFPQAGACGLWKPSIHMPREAARIFLRVTDVRVERLQDMKYKDMWAEGISNPCDSCNECYDRCDTCAKKEWEEIGFIALWNSTIKKDQLKYYGWESNPYVWVIEFEDISEEVKRQQS